MNLLPCFVLIPAIALEIIAAQRLLVFLQYISAFFSKKTIRFQKKYYNVHSLNQFISLFSILSFLVLALIHASFAFSELLETHFTTKNITFDLLYALIAFSSLVAIFLSQQHAIHRQISISLLASILLLALTLSQNDLVIFFLGVEITNLPFFLILFRSHTHKINLQSLTIHHFSGFFLALSSIFLIVFFQKENLKTTLSFDLYFNSNIPAPVHFLAIFLILFSPLARSFIPFFHVGLRIINTVTPAVSFTVVTIASLINIVFFLILHDKLFSYVSLYIPQTSIIFITTFLVVCTTFIPAAFTLISTSSIPTLSYTAISILHAHLIVILSLSGNANRFAFVCQIFITSALSSIILAILNTKLQRQNQPIRQFSDLQGITRHHPRLSFLLIASLLSAFAFPLSFNFSSQTFFISLEILKILPLPLHSPLSLIPTFILSALIIPQAIALSRLLILCFSNPLSETSIENIPHASAGNTLLLASFSLLVSLPFIFGLHTL
jgi:NADH:ubiquinone oxidoreductase subunit 2 (subunit N)